MTARALALGALAGWACAAGAVQALAAQDVRGWATSAVSYAELRPLRVDTVPQSRAVERSPGIFEVDGERVHCIAGAGCVRWTAAPPQSAAIATQDIALTGWGFGVEGLSAVLSARARRRFAGALVWPRSDDAFDLTLGYLQLNRGPLRVRAGRLESLSGLGFAGFDGADVLAVLLGGRGRVEGYGGRSLARGLREPRDAALRGLQDFLPERGAYLLGGALGWIGGGATTTAELRFQREAWSDRRGLISERASLDVRTTRWTPATLGAALDYDLGTARVGKGQLQLRVPLGSVGWGTDGELTVRRYLPYFDLYTIWGFFSPVAYHEVEARASGERGAVSVWAAGAHRWYQDADAEAFLEAPAARGWRLLSGGDWTPRAAWTLGGELAAEWIPGGFLTSADLSLRARVHPRLALTLAGTGFQQLEEYRVGDGRVLGVTLAADAALSRRLHLDAGGGAYRHRDGSRGAAFDWSQLRAWSSLRVEVGGDPGLEAAP